MTETKEVKKEQPRSGEARKLNEVVKNSEGNKEGQKKLTETRRGGRKR